MKKLFLTVVVVFCALSASAQNWSVGGRIGSGLQAVGQYHFSNANYVEARFGMGWYTEGATICADFTALYNWDIAKMDWTPRAGQWFFDAGCGLAAGGKGNYAYVGVAGMARFGIAFKGAPVALSLDWTPIVGPEIAYGGGYSTSRYFTRGLANLGITCVYNF